MADTLAAIADQLTDWVTDAFIAENTRRQEDRDPTKLTMSGLGSCTRRNAYSVAGIEPTDLPDPEEARMALLGTGIHDWFLPALARIIQANTGACPDVEHRVTLHAVGLEIRGNLDLAYDDVLLDLKTVREWKLGGVRRAGAFNEHRLQVQGYALARWQAGHDVRWVAYLYMDRTTGEVEPVVEPFDNESGLEVIRRVDTIKRFADDDPDSAPREGRGPGVSMVCDRCPWLRRCWGVDAKPGTTGAQTRLATTTPGLNQILNLYVEAAAVAGAAGRDKDFAKLVLERTKPAQYGPYVLNRGKPGEMDDAARMKEILTELGIDIPKKPKAGATSVKPAPTPKEGKKKS